MFATSCLTEAKFLPFDDEPVHRLALKMAFEGLGLTLGEAESCEEALRRLPEDRFAVVRPGAWLGPVTIFRERGWQ
ncbi:MAG: response regulator [Planctomycetes bacterium]|nr:response regulator [Planctomycetota bacterium]